MKASKFEFEQRFSVIGVIFGIAFFCYSIDHVASANALAGGLAHLQGVESSDLHARIVFALATLFVIAAAAVRTWATAYLDAAVMTDAKLHTDRLVADGPYRRVRNPLYLGNILLAIGMGVMASRLGHAVLVLGMTFFVLRLIGREEAGIEAQLGDSFRAFKAKVPLLIPALTPRLPPGGRTPKWKDGLLGEAWMWFMALAMAGMTVSLNQLVFFGILAGSFVVHGIALAILKRRKTT